MATVKGMLVRLKSKAEKNAGTKNHIYIGISGTGGGREFPLDVTNFNDYAEGSDVKYMLGTIWDSAATSGARQPFNSTPGGWNDPEKYKILLDKVDRIYIRKQGNLSTKGDDEYKLDSLEVTLYGDSGQQRTFRTGYDLWLGNEYGHQAWIPELGDILVLQTGPNVIIRINPLTGFQEIVTSGGLLTNPLDICADTKGNIFALNNEGGGRYTFIRIDQIGKQTSMFMKGPGSDYYKLDFDPVRETFWAGTEHGVERMSPEGQSTGVVSLSPDFAQPITLDDNGNTVVRYRLSGNDFLTRVAKDLTTHPLGSGGVLNNTIALGTDSQGNILALQANAITRIHPTTGVQTPFLSGGLLIQSSDIAREADGRLIVATGNSPPSTGQIIRIDPDTLTQTPVSSGGLLTKPKSMAVIPTR